MNPETEQDTFSIQIKISGRSVVPRNALIGAVVGAMLITAALTYGEPRLFVMFLPLFSGIAAGSIPAAMSWLGHVIARSTGEGDGRINWAAIKYAGLIPGVLGMWGMTTALISNNSALGGILLSGAVMIIAAVLSALLTIVVSTVIRALRRQSAPHMLNERQFDPLQHIESREHARR